MSYKTKWRTKRNKKKIRKLKKKLKLENRKKKKTEKILFNLERPDEMKETVGN